MQKRFQQPAGWQWDKMVNADGVALRTGSISPHSQPKAHLVFGAGLSEFAEKYFELTNTLIRLRYNYHTLDWRGQGGSPRYLSDIFKRHSIGLDHDARDLAQFVNHHVPDNAPRIYIGHSMGGLIGTMAIKDDPKLFRAGILATPLFGIADRRVAGLEPVLARAPLPKTFRERYIPGGGPWKRRDDPGAPLKPGDYTSDPLRMGLNDEWAALKPALVVGAPTIGCVQDFCRAITDLWQAGAAESIATPLLMISAGGDKLVRTSETFNMAVRVPGAVHMHFSAAKHEILLENDAIRRPIMKNIHNFIQANLP